MSTIIAHTTRAPGTILTAAIYNEDHLVHITNADTLNDDKAELGDFGSFTGIEAVDNVDDTHETLLFNESTHADADSDLIIKSGTNAEMHIFAKHADNMTYFSAFDGGIAFDTADADITMSAGGILACTIAHLTGVMTFTKQGVFTLGVTSPVGVVSTGTAMGYAAGAGGTVTQLTNKTTAVQIDKPSGEIVTHNESVANGSTKLFTVTNNKISIGDNVILSHKSGGTFEAYMIRAMNIQNGSFQISIWNLTGGPLAQAVTIAFTVIKGSVT